MRKCKCLSCNKDYSNKLDGELKKKFKNKFKFSNNDINKSVLLLRKGVYPYGYMDNWEKFNKQHYPKTKNFIVTYKWKKLQMQIICMKKNL